MKLQALSAQPLTKTGRKRPRHFEDIEARALWRWAQMVPELKQYLYHIPNGGRRKKTEAALLKAMGVRPGVSDFHLPLARGGFLGLWLELKATPPHDAAVSDTQDDWLKKMRAVGHYTYLAKGWLEAKNKLTWYLQQPPTMFCGITP